MKIVAVVVVVACVYVPSCKINRSHYKVKGWFITTGGEPPYNGLYGGAPPERGTFFKLEVYKRVGISRVQV